jgi:hypothetical protein
VLAQHGCDAVGKDPAYERAFYLAAESYALAGDQVLARKYAARFPKPIQIQRSSDWNALSAADSRRELFTGLNDHRDHGC